MSNGTFRTIPNPYIVGNPIRDPRMFFGREDDFAYVKNKFSGGKQGGMLVLCGARRSGKTSILFQVMTGRLGKEFVPVLIDMQAMTIRDDRDFLEKIAREIVSTVVHRGMACDAFDGSSEENPFSAFEGLARQVVAGFGGTTLVLMFDEYELFETNIDAGVITARILNLMANLIEHNRVFVVFTGSDKLEARNKPYWHIFLSKALHRKISFLSRNDTLRLILEPVGDLVSYGTGVPDRIFELTAGQPFYTQVLCQNIVDRLNECRKSAVSLQDVDAVVDEVIENPLPQMIFNWNSLTDLQKMTLSAIAEISGTEKALVSPRDIDVFIGGKRIGYCLDPAELNKGLESLFHADLLLKSAEGEEYGFKMDLWRLWVARMHSLWQVVHEMEGSEEGPGRGIARRQRRRSMTAVAVGAIAIAAVVTVAIWSMFSPGRSPAGAVAGGADLSVESTPSKASVFCGTEFLGVTPLMRARAPAGIVELRVQLPGFRPALDTLDLREGEHTTLAFELIELTGNLSVRSDPPGASILLDGSDVGAVTPATLRGLSANIPHRLDLRLAEHGQRTIEAVRVYADSTTAVTVSLNALAGALHFVSNPAGAEIRLDGTLVSLTPHIETGVPYGRHAVKISLAGYVPYEETVDLTVGSRRVEAALASLPRGQIICNVDPYADIYVNGELVSGERAHYEGSYAPGSYEVIFRHPEFGTYQASAEVKPGGSVTITHRFSNLEGG